MSLINQALRKAQRDRSVPSGESAPPGDRPGGHAAPAAASTRRRPSWAMLGGVGAFAVLLGLVAGLLVVLLSEREMPAPGSPQEPGEPVGNGPSPPQHTPSEHAKVPPAVNRPSQEPSAAAAEREALLGELRAARAGAEAAAAETADAPGPDKGPPNAEDDGPGATNGPDDAIIKWLGEAKITGVRISEDANKALINGRAYSAGETVHYGLGIKVLVIQEKRILFVDADGRKYLRRL